MASSYVLGRSWLGGRRNEDEVGYDSSRSSLLTEEGSEAGSNSVPSLTGILSSLWSALSSSSWISLNTVLTLVFAPLALVLLPFMAAVHYCYDMASMVGIWLAQLLLPQSLLRGRYSSRGKVVVITGASSGIGRGMAYEYARRGAALVLAARRHELLCSVAAQCLARGAADVLVRRTDVSKEADCKGLIDDAVERFGRLDVLVNNAGTAHSGLVESYTNETQFSSVMAVDFWGNVWPMLHALPHLRRSSGQVFVTASAAAFLTFPRQAFYNAAKAAVVQFFDTLRAEETVQNNMAVTIAMPGFIHSAMTAGADASSHIPSFWPMLTTSGAARALVSAAERRRHYVFVPLWYSAWLPFRTLAPETMDWFQRVFLLGRPPSETAGKLLAGAVGEKMAGWVWRQLAVLPLSSEKAA